jgi:hypothetical protein
MRTNYFHFAGIFLATALTLSCGKGDWFDDAKKQLGFSSIGGSNLLQNNRLGLGFMSTGEGVPDGDVNVIKDVQISGSALSGGSTSITVTSSEELEVLYLQIEGENGFYEWKLEPEDIVSNSNPFIYQIVLEFNQSLGEGDEGTSPTFIVSGKTKRGDIAESVEEKLNVKSVGSGALQVSLSWDKLDDVDLYVFTPSGERLYYGNRTSEDGTGKLDVDANAGCTINNPIINSENIFFEAPLVDGTYTVVVNLFMRCNMVSGRGTGGARYNVTANVNSRFVNFGKQNDTFGDSEQGNNGNGLDTTPTVSTSAVKVIGTIKIQNGQLVNN